MSVDAGDGDDEVDPDEAQVEREWHLWVLVAVVIGGVLLVVAPGEMVPGLVRGVGPLLIIVGVVGWLIKEVYRRWG